MCLWIYRYIFVLQLNCQRPERYFYSYELVAAIIIAHWASSNLTECRYEINVWGTVWLQNWSEPVWRSALFNLNIVYFY